MHDPELRQALVDEAEEADRRLQAIQAGVGGDPARLVVQGVNRQADLQQYVGRSVGEIAEAEGKHPIEVMLDLSLAGDLNVEFLGPDRGLERRVHGRDDELAVRHPRCVRRRRPHQVLHRRRLQHRLPHLARARRGRDHARGGPLPPVEPGRPGRRLPDRGALREGAAADVLVYDLEELAIDPPWIGDVEYDLPGGEWRRVQRAKGYQQIIVNGEVTFEDGECTGATPGRLLRGGRG